MATIGRRRFVTTLLAGGGAALLLPAAAKVAAADLCPYCGIMPFGPQHRYLHGLLAPGDAIEADRIIARESRWDASATNPSSGAAGLAQFLDSTWGWGEELFGIYGSPYEPYTAIAMMAAFINDGQWYHWACTPESGCA